MKPDIHALSEPNPWQNPPNPGAIPLDIGNPMATDAECTHHSNLWKIFKNQHDSFIIIGHSLCTVLDKTIPDQFKPVQQIGNCGLGNFALRSL